jgi:pilus assembly protein CpaD
MRHLPFIPAARGRAILVALAWLPVLAACQAVDRREIVGSIPEDYRTKHPIVIEEGLATLDIPVGSSSSLPGDLRGNIAAFARNYHDAGGTMMAVLVPVGSPNQTMARAVGAQIRQLLVAQGIPAKAIDMRVYQAGPKEDSAAVRLAYSRVAAKVADTCGRWPDNTEVTFENRNYSNFGCATQQNLAAAVANPNDLVYPREMTPPDAERRNTVLGSYRTGDPTQSDPSRDGSARIVNNVGQ